MTCKKKRLKCDETKPTCVQCEKRNVECEGYKKDYKWRTFEETSKHSRVGKGKKPSNANRAEGQSSQAPPQLQQQSQGSVPAPIKLEDESKRSPGLHHAFTTAAQAMTSPPVPPQPAATKSPVRRHSPSQFDPLPVFNPEFSPSALDLPSPLPHNLDHTRPPLPNGSSHSSFSAGSPTLVDLLPPGTDMRQPPDLAEMRPPASPKPYRPGFAAPDLSGMSIHEDEDFDEEIVRDAMHDHIMDISEPEWRVRASSPAHSDASSTSSISTDLSILRVPAQDPSSPDMLMLRFDKLTCGILSIKDGINNPWRTLVWPMAENSLALRHAVFSMSALHGATSDRRVRLAGIAHMQKSISKLSTDIHNMSLDQALATALALALGEGWDDKISTGVQHLRGAKTLINRALAQHANRMQQRHFDERDTRRLKFLCNTYVYLDVIARLTSLDEQDPVDLEDVLTAVNGPPSNMETEVDPLMGCASTLFPLIGKVASLIQRVRRTSSNSLNVVSEANELREQLFQWRPPNVDMVDDAEINVEHAIQTAEAYRRAILLHLHQAVPELPSSTSAHAQAKGILTILAATPLSSPTLIIQIFPLLVGSCEMVSQDDRQWVADRWQAMIRRLSIVNVASSWELVQEVWRRRDLHIEEQARRLASRNTGRNAAPLHFFPPSLKRMMAPTEAVSEDAFFDTLDGNEVMLQNANGRPLKRRMTFDASIRQSGAIASHTHVASGHRRHTDITISNLDPEYTVRGHLHWLGVMSFWNWEVFLG